MTVTAVRGEAVTCCADPFEVGPAASLRHIPDALVVMEDGRFTHVGPFDEAAVPAGVAVTHHRDALLVPGFIDAHVHYPQLDVIAAFGEQLLEWLTRYTFPAEARFADPAHAGAVAERFLRELLRAGTTTACVYCTVHPASVDAFFEASERWGTRMIAGKVLMDRNAPEELTDSGWGIEASRALIRRWHGRGRQLYAVTPRFAPTSTPEQLRAAGELWREHPGTYMQTHLAENRAECAWVEQLFPEAGSYLDVYHRAGLTGRRAVFGHAIHMDEADFSCCHATGSALAHCPTSNLFIGSGLFRAFEARRRDRPVHLALGTDVGGGTSLSQLETLNEAYKVAMMEGGGRLTAAHGLYLATRGGAEALDLGETIGSLEAGLEADLVVLDGKATPLIAGRMAAATDLMERLFVLMTLGDDRAVRATYVAGQAVYRRDRADPFEQPTG